MSDKHWGAFEDEWLGFSLAGLSEDLLPVVSNPNVTIAPTSRLRKLGKTPSRYNASGSVVGIRDWTNHKTTEEELDAWSSNPDYGICLQTRHIRAFDIDVPDRKRAAEIQELIEGELHWLGLPIRFRQDSGKCLLAFRYKGPLVKRQMQVNGGMIELLADGNQFVAAGTHPDGARYEWQFAKGAENEYPTLTLEQLNAVWTNLENYYAVAPSTAGKAARVKGDHIAIDDPLIPYLRTHPAYLGEDDDKKIFITCPFKDQHTDDSGESETVYFPKGSNGHIEGHFVCMHAHCKGRSNSAFELALGYNDFTCEEASCISPGKPDEEELFPIFSAHEYMKRPRPGWIIRNVLPRAEIAAIYGESGAGKTFLALDMALSIARGLSWSGHDVVQGRVVYIAAEGAGGFRNRIEAYCMHNEISVKDVPIQVVPAAPNFLSGGDAIKLSKTVVRNGGPAAVIFVDTLAQVTIGGNENAAEDMSKAIANCKGIHVATGAMVVLVHHAGKDLERGLRGWSGLKGALDANIEVRKNDGEARIMYIEKMKDGKDGDAWTFRLSDVILPNADDPLADEEKSCVVQFEGPYKYRGNEKRIWGAWQKICIAVYNGMEKTENGVDVDELKIGMVQKYKQSKPQNEDPIWKLSGRAKRAIHELIDKKVVILNDNAVTLC